MAHFTFAPVVAFTLPPIVVHLFEENAFTFPCVVLNSKCVGGDWGRMGWI